MKSPHTSSVVTDELPITEWFHEDGTLEISGNGTQILLAKREGEARNARWVVFHCSLSANFPWAEGLTFRNKRNVLRLAAMLHSELPLGRA